MKYSFISVKEFGGPDSLRVVGADVPKPKEDEVLVRMEAAGVSYADAMWVSGKVPGGPKPPFVPGYDVTGTIEQVGNRVVGYQKGQRVTALLPSGGYAEYLTIPVSKLAVVPAQIEPQIAACLTVNYLAAYQIYRRVTGLKTAGARILIHGAAGGIGTALLELGRLFNFQLFGTETAIKHDILKQFGAQAIDYRTENFTQRIKQLAPNGVDLAVDPIGGYHFAESFSCLRPGGILIGTATMGVVQGVLNRVQMLRYFLQIPIWNLLPNDRRAVFFDIIKLNEKHPDWFVADLKVLQDYLLAGKIKPIVFATFPLKDVSRAHELLLQGKVTGKVVLI